MREDEGLSAEDKVLATDDLVALKDGGINDQVRSGESGKHGLGSVDDNWEGGVLLLGDVVVMNKRPGAVMEFGVGEGERNSGQNWGEVMFDQLIRWVSCNSSGRCILWVI